ncbi:SNARE associated Golgi protein-like protein [Haliangium ochraceum DSM 14365]|uniref:SNARE associated Golgi protein-like protein n=2 Tax=Haliangium ochraceum TaxID=80816 RepID=D0LYM0_HALO1|nr:SNARE associated Golgi protein-like protein [Haliangium ochraceum DSM 14365]
MDAITESFIAFISQQDNFVGLLCLALAAMIEYLVPPFPGDTITLFGAVLITSQEWSFWGVFGAVMAGSVVGSMAAFYAGKWWRRRSAEKHRPHPKLERLVGKFDRHGAAYLVLNRFLPGIRSLFFVAAGMAAMRPHAVLAYSALSAALWNLGIIAIGSALGANFETLLGWVKRYTTLVWVIIGVLVLLWLARLLWRRTRAAAPEDAADTDADGPGEGAGGPGPA